MVPPAALLFILISQQPAPRIAAASEALIGKPAPPVQLPLVDGSQFDLAQHKGKIVFLAFWATWCEPCRREIPRLLAAEANYKDLFVLGVSAEEPAAVRRFLEEEHFDFRSAVDAGKRVSDAYGIDLVPRLFVIDQRGVVVKMIRGLPGEGTIRRTLDSLLPRGKSVAGTACGGLGLRRHARSEMSRLPASSN